MTSIAPKLAPIIYKLAKDAYESDHDHWYGLTYNVCYGKVTTKRFKAFDYEDDLFLVEKVNEDTSIWWIKAFEPETHYWDGTSNLPDRGTKSLDALLRASLFHDCGYAKVEDISKATGIPEKDLLAFFDDCFKLLSEGYGASKKVTNPIYQVLRLGGSLYHKIMKLLALLTFLTLFQGCYSVQTHFEDPTPPEIHFTGPFTLKEQYENQETNPANMPLRP